MSTPNQSEEQSYSFRYFDKPNEGEEHDSDSEDDEDGEFDLDSCAKDCCDHDCECDDCLRCSAKEVRTDEDDYLDLPAAAA